MSTLYNISNINIKKQIYNKLIFIHVLGYAALHHAAAWGKVSLLKVLVDALADLQLKTAHGERARETALRYNQTECVDFLDWAGKCVQFYDYIENIFLQFTLL